MPEVFKVFMTALIDVASYGKDLNTPATTVRQLQRCFHHDDRGRHDGKEKKKKPTAGGSIPLMAKTGKEEISILTSDDDDVRTMVVVTQ